MECSSPRSLVRKCATLFLMAALSLQVLACKKKSHHSDSESSVESDGDDDRTYSDPIRRLTGDEYNRSAGDLIGQDLRVNRGFLADEMVQGYKSNASVTMNLTLVQQYEAAAHSIASAANTDSLIPCQPSGERDPECAVLFIQKFGRKAYRRPLSNDEVARFAAIFQDAQFQTFDMAARQVISIMTQSPNFLYKVESGDGSPPNSRGLVRLSTAEVASRLSYAIWGSLPDENLVSVVDGGGLTTLESLTEQAERLLASPRAKDGFSSFYNQWLGLETLSLTSKDPAKFPHFMSLRDSMYGETQRFIDDAVWQGDGTLSSLLLGSLSSLDQQMVMFYGLDPVPSNEPSTYDTSVVRRRGILMQASLMSIYSHNSMTSPVLRGKFIRERFLCQLVGDPPPDVATSIDEPREQTTTRDQFDQHSHDPACSGCHRLMDPLGVAFEGFDAVGALRDTDQGREIDAHGELNGTRSINGDFTGADSLVQILANSGEVHECVGTQWYRFMVGHKEMARDKRSLARIKKSFSSGSGKFTDLYRQFVLSDAFIYKRVAY